MGEINEEVSENKSQSLWPNEQIDRIAKRGSGHTPSRSYPEYWNGNISWISLADSNRLDKLYIYDTEVKISNLGIRNSSAVIHPKGTVVLSRDAGVGKSAIMFTDMAVSQHFIAWKCGPKLDNEFFYYWLQSKKSEFDRIAIGNTIKTIGLPYFKQLQCPAPSIAEQKKISTILKNTDETIFLLEKLIVKKRNIKLATMQQLLTGKTRLPGFSGKWEKIKIGEFAECSAGGTPNTNNPQYWGGSIPWMNSGELNLKFVASVEGRITEKGLKESSTKLIPANCVLIGLAGQGKTRGTVAINKFELCTNQSIAAIYPSPKINSNYLFYNLENRYQELRNMSTGDGGRGGLNLSIIRSIQVQLPSMSEQIEISEILLTMDKEMEQFESKLAKLKLLKQGMMQELLTGRIRLV